MVVTAAGVISVVSATGIWPRCIPEDIPDGPIRRLIFSRGTVAALHNSVTIFAEAFQQKSSVFCRNFGCTVNIQTDWKAVSFLQIQFLKIMPDLTVVFHVFLLMKRRRSFP